MSPARNIKRQLKQTAQICTVELAHFRSYLNVYFEMYFKCIHQAFFVFYHYLIDVGVPVLIMRSLGFSAIDAGEEGGLCEVHARRVQAKRLSDHLLDTSAHVSTHINAKAQCFKYVITLDSVKLQTHRCSGEV